MRSEGLLTNKTEGKLQQAGPQRYRHRYTRGVARALPAQSLGWRRKCCTTLLHDLLPGESGQKSLLQSPLRERTTNPISVYKAYRYHQGLSVLGEIELQPMLFGPLTLRTLPSLIDDPSVSRLDGTALPISSVYCTNICSPQYVGIAARVDKHTQHLASEPARSTEGSLSSKFL